MTASPTVIDAALHQVDAGFAVFALGRNTKVPATEHGFKNATQNPEWVKTQLSAASAGNYGIVWPADAQRTVVVFDLDNGDGATETWEDRLRVLMDKHGWLPPTKSTTTPSGGRHAFFYWPADVPVPPGDELFGFTVRWPGRGYLVGPGSSIDGKPYVPGAVDDIAELPRTWVDAALEYVRQQRKPAVDGATITIDGGYQLPERVQAGRRYATIRDYVASRYNSGLNASELWRLVQTEVAPRFEQAKTERELRGDFDRVMAKITERLGPPAKQMRPEDAVAALSPIQVVPLSDIATEAVEWLWFRYLPTGGVTLFDGNPGEGKSTIVADLIARMTRGTEWPDGTPIDAPGTVLYITKEDDPAKQVRPRIEAAGGDVSRVMFVAADLLFPRDAGRFGELLEQVRPRLVLLDPLMSYLEGKVRAISDNEVRSAIMTPLAELAREIECAILVIRHFAKASGTSALNRGAGSLGGLAGAARAVLGIAVDPEDDDDRTRVFGVIKSNFEARPPSLRGVIESAPVEGFQMTVSRVAWLGNSDTSIVDLMERSREEHQKLLDAKEVLAEILREHGEPMPSKDATAAMAARKFSGATIHRARAALRVHVERTGFPASTYWSLPVLSVVSHESTGESAQSSHETTGESVQSSHATTDETTGEMGTPGGQSSQSSHDESTGGPRVHADAGARAGSPLHEMTGLTGGNEGDSTQSSQSSHRNRPPRTRAREATGPELHVVRSESEWAKPCRDYEHHRNSHRRTDAGWVCDACYPEGVA